MMAVANTFLEPNVEDNITKRIGANEQSEYSKDVWAAGLAGFGSTQNVAKSGPNHLLISSG